MLSRVRTWGHSLAVRIPRHLADAVGLRDQSMVEMVPEDGHLVLRPVSAPGPTLEELVSGITDANRHAEVDYGPLAGAEAW